MSHTHVCAVDFMCCRLACLTLLTFQCRACWLAVFATIGDPDVIVFYMSANKENPAERNAVAIAAVSIKLLPFWPADPHVWFAQVEAQFATQHITVQKTIFDYAVASLSPEFTTEVRNLILSPPEGDPYNVLKVQLVRRTAASEQRRLQQLFHAEELGDRKPSQLLRRLQQLLGDATHRFNTSSGNCSCNASLPMPPFKCAHGPGLKW